MMPWNAFGRWFGLALCLSCLACTTTTSSQSSSGADPIQKMDAQQLRDMGEKFLAVGDATNALRFLTVADQKQPNDAHIQYDLGDAYDARGLPDQALQHFQKAIQLKADYPEAYNAMGKVYADQGRYDDALQAFQQALGNPFYQTPYLTLFNTGLVYEKQQNWQLALSHYQHALKANKNFGPAYYRMGKVLEAMGRKPEARDAYANAVQFAPSVAEVHYDFARISYETGDFTNAAFSFARVMQLAPNTPMAADADRQLQAIEKKRPR
ncbi:MAG TPA: hypothetical protein DCZ69_06680 [Syntrophobacteraceae bacterium]|nr:hypothetical protein [Syntrophobacteraceae bacterium]HBZ54708.1 hypothetical protein [Syntrophobacteraceae bacterium]